MTHGLSAGLAQYQDDITRIAALETALAAHPDGMAIEALHAAQPDMSDFDFGRMLAHMVKTRTATARSGLYFLGPRHV